jgi:hypothetical protein
MADVRPRLGSPKSTAIRFPQPLSGPPAYKAKKDRNLSKRRRSNRSEAFVSYGGEPGIAPRAWRPLVAGRHNENMPKGPARRPSVLHRRSTSTGPCCMAGGVVLVILSSSLPTADVGGVRERSSLFLHQENSCRHVKSSSVHSRLVLLICSSYIPLCRLSLLPEAKQDGSSRLGQEKQSWRGGHLCL